VFSCAGNGLSRRLWAVLDHSPNFTTPLLSRGDELHELGYPAACILVRKLLTVGEFYLLSLTSRGEIR
jgi:hypothetical protein